MEVFRPFFSGFSASPSYASSINALVKNNRPDQVFETVAKWQKHRAIASRVGVKLNQSDHAAETDIPISHVRVHRLILALAFGFALPKDGPHRMARLRIDHHNQCGFRFEQKCRLPRDHPQHFFEIRLPAEEGRQFYQGFEFVGLRFHDFEMLQFVLQENTGCHSLRFDFEMLAFFLAGGDLVAAEIWWRHSA